MSATIRRPFSGVGRKLLPKILSSDSSVFKLSEGPKNYISRSLKPFVPLNRVIYNNYGSSFSTFSKTYKLNLPTKLIGSYIDHPPLVRQFGLSVFVAGLPLKNYFNTNPKALSERIIPPVHNLITEKPNVKYSDVLSARKYSSTDKPISNTTGTGLADQIMQSRMKEPSPTKHVEEDIKSTGDDTQGPKPVSKWQKRGYMAFAIFLGGALVVNGVLFCK